MKRTRALALMMVLPALVLVPGCQSPSGGGAEGGDILRIGITPTLPPMVFKQGRDLVGLEVDAARELAGELGRSVRFVEVSWENQIPSLLSKKTDIIMSSMTITPERRMRVAFSSPYLNVGQLMLVRRTDVNRYALGFPAVLPGTVGVIRGTVGEFFVQRESPGSTRRSFTTAAEAVAALAGGRIDSFISDAPIIWYQAALNEGQGLGIVPRMMTGESLGWAVRPGDPELLRAVNDFIARHQADGSLNVIIKRWLPLSN